MNAVGALEKTRNTLIVVGAACVATSATAALAVGHEWWKSVMDYWLVWASVFTGLGGVISTVAAVFAHCIAIDESRSN